jgi:hypothetical protein
MMIIFTFLSIMTIIYHVCGPMNLFLYSNLLSLEFHRQAIQAMCRVAAEPSIASAQAQVSARNHTEYVTPVGPSVDDARVAVESRANAGREFAAPVTNGYNRRSENSRIHLWNTPDGIDMPGRILSRDQRARYLSFGGAAGWCGGMEFSI